MARRDEGADPEWSVTEEAIPQARDQAALSAKTLRATGLLAWAVVGSAVTARFGDAPASPPRPSPKSLVAEPLPIFRQALRLDYEFYRPVFSDPMASRDGVSPQAGDHGSAFWTELGEAGDMLGGDIHGQDVEAGPGQQHPSMDCLRIL